jgi:hypothetical protein
LNVDGSHVNLHDFGDPSDTPVEVVFSTGKIRRYQRVTSLDANALDIVLQTKAFMDFCLRVRTRILDQSNVSVDVQRSAQLLEEALGAFIVPAQPEKVIERRHAAVFASLCADLNKRGHKLANERVGTLGPDLYTIGKGPKLLFEIKTSISASDFSKAVGQLYVYETVLKDDYRKFIVVPHDLGDLLNDVLKSLGIAVVIYTASGSNYTFSYPKEFEKPQS